jgi:replicative DNA helicase
MTTQEQQAIKDRIEEEKALFEYAGPDQVLPSKSVYSLLNEQAKNKVDLSSGIAALEEKIYGFWGGELTVISGPTGHGKTLLCQSLTNNFSNFGHRSLWFSYEVPAKQFIEQFGGPLELMYMPNILQANSLHWIRQRILEAKLKYQIEAVFVDHLHFLADVMISRNPSLEIGQVMRIVKRWALEFNVCFFLIAHTTKTNPDVTRELGLGDVRDSSFIEQEADNVFYVWRSKEKNGAWLKIAKNRRMAVYNEKIELVKDGLFLKGSF